MTAELDSPRFDFATAYPDRGCDVHPRCLSCPLARCKYDAPQHSTRDREIAALYLTGAAVDALAVRFRLSRRSVFRIVRGPRDG